VYNMKRVGRPPLPYAVRHVTINMKAEHYLKMRRKGINMSKEINGFLDKRFNFSICPACYTEDDLSVERCAKCAGRVLFCQNLRCKRFESAQLRECAEVGYSITGVLQYACTDAEFAGSPSI